MKMHQNLLEAINPPWVNNREMDTLEEQLLSATIIDIMDMRDYLNIKNKTACFAGEVYIVLLSNGIKAVWKPRDTDGMHSAYAEVAGFKASQWLAKYSGWHLVSPTIMKEYNERIGSLQWFVESRLDLWIDNQRQQGYSLLKEDDLAFGAAFIHVFGQWDIHPGNYLMPNNRENSVMLVFIDLEGIGNRKYSRSIEERPFVRISFNVAMDDAVSSEAPIFLILKKPTFLELKHAWQEFELPDTRLSNIHENIATNGTQDISYMIWRGNLWLQFHRKNLKAFPKHVPTYPEHVIKAYEQLDLKVLKDIFSLGIQNLPHHFNDSFLSDIINRKRQLLIADRSHKKAEENSVMLYSFNADPSPELRLATTEKKKELNLGY